MKILVLQDWLRSGGTERQSVLLANAFAAAGPQTTLMTFRPGGTLADTVSTKVNRHALQPFDTRLDWFAPGLLRAVQQISPDIVLCMGRMANCYAGKIQRAFPRTQVVATMRTGKSLPSAFRRSLTTVRHVVANSAEARDLLVSGHGVAATHVSVIYNSLVFSAPDTLARNDALRSALGAQADTTVMICVAMFRPEKNQRELIATVAALPTTPAWQLWLAGEGEAKAACERLVAEKKMGDRVKFLGFHRDPSPLYQAADIAVHASAHESLSNFLIEAQAHGLPAVVYAAQGVGECFIPGETGWIVPQGDRAEFIKRLEPLIANPALRAACADPAREYARTHFDAGRQVHAYLDLFGRLVQRRADS